MDKQMLSMEELEQVAGGNILDDAWDWICDKAEDVYDKIKPGRAPFAPEFQPMDPDLYPNFPIAGR